MFDGIILSVKWLLVIALMAAAAITGAAALVSVLVGSGLFPVQLLVVFALIAMGLFVFLSAFTNKVNRKMKVMDALVNSISDVIVVKDFDGNFVYCNQSVADLYQCQPSEMVGKNDYAFTGNKEQCDFFTQSAQNIMRRFKSEEVIESSTDVNTGEIRHFKSLKIPFYDHNHELNILIFAKDITDIIELKEQSERNKNRLEHVLEVSDEGLWEWDAQTGDIYHNQKWAEICGIEQMLEFEQFEQCIVEEDKHIVYSALDRLTEQKESYNIEFRITHTNGDVVWIWDRAKISEYDQDGNPKVIVGIVLDITEEKKNQDKIYQLAYYDSLTGLKNRAHLLNDIKANLMLNQKRGTYAALFFLDLDRFKLLNDSYGHSMGDCLLSAVAERLKSVQMLGGTVARFGGDEFVIILPNLDQEQQMAYQQAKRYAQRLIEVISHPFDLYCAVQNSKVNYAISTSVGGVIFQYGLPEEQLLQSADMAVYRAKHLGGNQVVVFDTKMQDEMRTQTHFHHSIKEALQDRQFCLYMQPIVDTSYRIVGAEALIRWQHPTLGLIAPDQFMSVVEESNWGVALGEYVLSLVCEQLECWQQNRETQHLSLSINLSAKQLWQSQFTEQILSIISNYQFDRSKLTIEVTESVLIQDIEDACDKLSQLKSYGMRISLDDFGTGYSSLGYLRQLPVDELKVDKSFISDLSNDEKAYQLVKAIIDLAKHFNIDTVIEGVETAEQLVRLQKHKVHRYQGHYFHKPVPIEQFGYVLDVE